MSLPRSGLQGRLQSKVLTGGGGPDHCLGLVLAASVRNFVMDRPAHHGTRGCVVPIMHTVRTLRNRALTPLQLQQRSDRGVDRMSCLLFRLLPWHPSERAAFAEYGGGSARTTTRFADQSAASPQPTQRKAKSDTALFLLNPCNALCEPWSEQE